MNQNCTGKRQSGNRRIRARCYEKTARHQHDASASGGQHPESVASNADGYKGRTERRCDDGSSDIAHISDEQQPRIQDEGERYDERGNS